MFKSFQVKNLGPLADVSWKSLGGVNVVVGTNDTGKTYMIKLMYSIARAAREYALLKKAERPTFRQVLSDKIRRVFIPSSLKLGRLVRRNQTGPLSVETNFLNRRFDLSFSSGADKQIGQISEISSSGPPSVYYFPAKEVLSLSDLLWLRSEMFDTTFDDTYWDLLSALRHRPGQGNKKQFQKDAIARLSAPMDGTIAWTGKRFEFQRAGFSYSMSETSEGFKKLGALSYLIDNRSIEERTILFFDEPEVNLHPVLISIYVEAIFELAKYGVQTFIVTHNYFVLKHVELCARRLKVSTPLLSLFKTSERNISFEVGDLSRGMIANEIVSQSTAMLEKQLRLPY